MNALLPLLRRSRELAGNRTILSHPVRWHLSGALVLLAALAAPGQAATLNVPSQYPDIASAVSAANNGDTVLVADGTYAAQGFQTGKTVTIQSVNGAASTIVDCTNNSFADLRNSGATIQGFTFENASFFPAIDLFSSNATIANCVFQNNDAEFINPSCIAVSSSQFTITGCTFTGNVGEETIDFAAANGSISNCTFTNNSSAIGGGAFYMNTGTVTVTDSTFTGNTGPAPNGSGGAIVWLNGALTLTRCTFTNNASAQGGGAIYLAAEGINTSVTAQQCTFTGNAAPVGGVFFAGSSSGTDTINAIDDVFVGNSAQSEGAVIATQNPLAVTNTYNITNCSFTSNTLTAPAANAGILASGAAVTLNLLNTIMYGDTNASEVSSANPPSALSVTASDIHGGGFAGANGNFDADPLFVDPVNGNLELTAASPAIGAGTATGAPTIDFLGITRPNPPSVGAFEPIYATRLIVNVPNPSVSYNNIQTTVTAEDAFGNVATTYNGTVTFTSSDPSFIAPAPLTLVNGTASENGAALKTAGTQSVTATDISNPGLTGTDTVTVVPGPIVGLGIALPPSATAGAPFTFTVYGRDLFGNVTPSYTGTVHFTSSDPNAVLPADTVITNGTGTFSATLETSGDQTITATDAANSYSASLDLPVNGGAPASLSVTVAPGATTSGGPVNVTVTALDQFGNVSNTYGGTIHFTSSDPLAGLPADSPLSSGTTTLTAYLYTVGNQTITATDTSNSSLAATSNTVAVSAIPATQFSVSAPANATAGTPVAFTVTAEDSTGSTATGYTGTVHFTTTDRYGVLPADTTLTNGVGTFNATFGTVGTQTITAADSANSLTGTSSGVTVSHGSVALFGIRVRSTTVVDGAPFALNVYAYDTYGNQVNDYTGTIHFSSTDTNAVLPADTVLTNGQGSFSVTLYALGSQSITISGAGAAPAAGLAPRDGTVSGTQTFTVIDNPAVRFRMNATPATSIAGAPTTITILAQDAAGNTARGYTGTVHLSTNAAGAVLPPDATLTNGTGTFQITFTIAGRYTITATDLANTSLTGTSGSVNVSAGTATHLKATAQTSAVKGVRFGVVVQALDAYGNVAPSYTGTVHLTSTDANAVLPADGALYSGQRTFLVTLKTLGGQTVTATDTINSDLTATTGAVTITAH